MTDRPTSQQDALALSADAQEAGDPISAAIYDLDAALLDPDLSGEIDTDPSAYEAAVCRLAIQVEATVEALDLRRRRPDLFA